MSKGNKWKSARGGGVCLRLSDERMAYVDPATLDPLTPQSFGWYVGDRYGKQELMGTKSFPTAREAIADCERALVREGILAESSHLTQAEEDARHMEGLAALAEGVAADSGNPAILEHAARYRRAAAALRAQPPSAGWKVTR